MSFSVESESETQSESLYLGRVKWFNNKAGYGFITVTDGEHKDTDIFVHHSFINVGKEQYKYLVQGEYVEFRLASLDKGPHKWQAVNISGIKGGQLMCETRKEVNILRSSYKYASRGEVPVREAFSSTEVSSQEEVSYTEEAPSKRKPRAARKAKVAPKA